MDNYTKFRNFINGDEYLKAPWSLKKEPLKPVTIKNYMYFLESASNILFDNDTSKLGHTKDEVLLLKYFHLLDKKFKLNSNTTPLKTKKNILCAFRIYGEFLYYDRTGEFREESSPFRSTLISSKFFKKKSKSTPDVTDKKEPIKIHEDLIALANCSIATLEFAVLQLLSRYPNGLSTNQIDKHLRVELKKVMEFILSGLVKRKLVKNSGSKKSPNWKKAR